ncbi:Deoxyuridine 5'-triphosphate nucleotidohydrolase [Folsomia candida]|uniref:Deoxyuridine 5'-triphosphate nucleotidohydrolase n=1 Tax=Folsomia candida TaxID=158441 RepID=A0A226EDK0_FOLCA|nr:Deoxyuridine 5'-triphosphate nucleotidohydrolase [Folsomia candida]
MSQAGINAVARARKMLEDAKPGSRESEEARAFFLSHRRQPDVIDAGFVVEDDEEEPSGPFTDEDEEEEDEEEDDDDSPSEPEEDPDFVPANEHSQKQKSPAEKRSRVKTVPPSGVPSTALVPVAYTTTPVACSFSSAPEIYEAYVPPTNYKGPTSLNFAPEGERSDHPSGQNIVHWEGQLGQGFWLKLQTWRKNGQAYVCIRKNQTTGANLSFKYFQSLVAAYEYRTVHFIRKTFESKFPTKLHPQSAGYDLYSQSGALLKAGEMKLMDIGIQVKLPYGHVGLIKPRSGLALRNKIDILGGVVDEDFEGTLGVMLINHGKAPHEIERGDRIAQLLVVKLHNGPLKKSTFDEVVTTTTTTPVVPRRGAKGFGSSGK